MASHLSGFRVRVHFGNNPILYHKIGESQIETAEVTAAPETETGKKPPRHPEPAAGGRTSPATPVRKPASPGAPFAKLTPRESFELYRSFYQGANCRLPEPLKSATALAVKIHSVGGARDISDLSKFVVGNRSGKVSIRARRRSDSELMAEWVPDETPEKRLTFRLAGNGLLAIGLPHLQTEESPRLADVARITFFSAGGEQCGFDMDQLPAAIDDILNREAKITVKNDDAHIRFFLNVSDDLWAFRKFYTIEVDGRKLGADINEREIPLRDLDLNMVAADIRKRNVILTQFKALEDKERELDRELGPPPRIPHGKRLRELFQAKRQKNPVDILRDAALRNDEREWLLQLDDIAEGLERKVAEKAIKERERKAFISGLTAFKEECKDYVKRRAELAQIRKNLEARREDYLDKTEALKEKLKNLYPALYRAAGSALKSADPLPLEDTFYRKIKQEELLKDIKVAIIRKARQ